MKRTSAGNKKKPRNNVSGRKKALRRSSESKRDELIHKNTILIGVMVAALSGILFCFTLGRTSGQKIKNNKDSVQKQQEVAPEAANNTVAVWESGVYQYYYKDIQIASINTASKSIWYCTVTDTDGNLYAVYQPYAIAIKAAPEGYTATSPHELSPAAKASWLYDIEKTGTAGKIFTVKIQNYPDFGWDDTGIPNGADEIPKDKEYIMDLEWITNIYTGESTQYRK